MLDDRAKLLLKALVERYIAEGQPVGSRTLSRASGLELSPATIRNVMSDLEELGLIASPHTSAGPHPDGARLPPVRGHHAHGAARADCAAPSLAPDQPQKVIANAAHLLSNLSQFVGVVMAPRRTLGVPPHRVPAPVGTALPGHHRLARRRRAEPRGLHRGRLHAVAADRGRQLPQRQLRRHGDRAGARAPEERGGASCAARSAR